MKSKIDFKKQGKKNRAAGARFELCVRKDLELKGGVVSKWMNNVGMWDEEGNQIVKRNGKYFIQKTKEEIMFKEIIFGKCIPAKHKFRGSGIPMAIGTGFPDFIVFKKIKCKMAGYNSIYEIMGIECKMRGYLDKEERAKCKWLLDNKIFGGIQIAKKGKQRGIIEYKMFGEIK